MISLYHNDISAIRTKTEQCIFELANRKLYEAVTAMGKSIYVSRVIIFYNRDVMHMYYQLKFPLTPQQLTFMQVNPIFRKYFTLLKRRSFYALEINLDNLS